MTDTITIKEFDKGEWFRMDGRAIKTQPQLDLAVINLAEFYGFTVLSEEQMETLYQTVHETDDEWGVPRHLRLSLIRTADSAIKYLNSLLPAGWKFTFTGEEYEVLVLTDEA